MQTKVRSREAKIFDRIWRRNEPFYRFFIETEITYTARFMMPNLENRQRPLASVQSHKNMRPLNTNFHIKMYARWQAGKHCPLTDIYLLGRGPISFMDL